MNVMRPIRNVDDLEEAGLIDAGEALSLGAVAERYAIALTPAVQG